MGSTRHHLFARSALALALLTFASTAAQADVKTKEKSQVKFEGMLGRMIGMFGGKAMKDGVLSANAVKGDRKSTMTDTTGRIVDLSEEKVYDIDLKKKSYTVTTFAELRQHLKEAQEKARADAEKAAKEEAGRDKPADAAKTEKSPEVEVDFDVKETGQKKTLIGYEAREVIMTITVREKGRALEDGGGVVVTSDLWLGPDIPAMKELGAFELRYWKAIAPETTGVSAEQMAAVIAAYPMVKQGMDRLNREKGTLHGTGLATVTTFEAVKSREQLEQSKPSSGGGGISGILASRMMKKDDKPRATIFSVTTETQEISTSVSPADLEIPAGFKQAR